MESGSPLRPYHYDSVKWCGEINSIAQYFMDCPLGGLPLHVVQEMEHWYRVSDISGLIFNIRYFVDGDRR